MTGPFAAAHDGGAVGDQRRFGQQRRAHRSNVRTGDPGRFEVAERVSDLAVFTDLAAVQGEEVLHKERRDPQVRTTVSGPFEYPLGDPLSPPLRTGTFAECRVKRQI